MARRPALRRREARACWWSPIWSFLARFMPGGREIEVGDDFVEAGFDGF